MYVRLGMPISIVHIPAVTLLQTRSTDPAWATVRILLQTDHPFSSETDQCSPVKAISVLQ
jgi:hypothetical protein